MGIRILVGGLELTCFGQSGVIEWIEIAGGIAVAGLIEFIFWM